jgi:hypothetical protein
MQTDYSREISAKLFRRAVVSAPCAALSRRARLYERIASPTKAAAMYELYARNYGGEKDAWDALSSAIVPTFADDCDKAIAMLP